MINTLVLVGRVCEDPKQITLDKGYKVTNFTLAVQRYTKNEKNEYEVDFIPISAWSSLSDIICDYVRKGSVIGVRGRLSTKIVDINNQKFRQTDVIAEQVSFINIKNDKNKELEDPIDQIMDDDINQEVD